MNIKENTANSAISKMSAWLAGTRIEHTSLGHTVTHTSERHLDAHEHLFFEGDKILTCVPCSLWSDRYV